MSGILWDKHVEKGLPFFDLQSKSSHDTSRQEKQACSEALLYHKDKVFVSILIT